MLGSCEESLHPSAKLIRSSTQCKFGQILVSSRQTKFRPKFRLQDSIANFGHKCGYHRVAQIFGPTWQQKFRLASLSFHFCFLSFVFVCVVACACACACGCVCACACACMIPGCMAYHGGYLLACLGWEDGPGRKYQTAELGIVLQKAHRSFRSLRLPLGIWRLHFVAFPRRQRSDGVSISCVYTPLVV